MRMGSKKVPKKGNKWNQLCIKVQDFCENGLWLWISLYMFMIMVGLPFYFTDGYARIGTNKYEFFYTVTTKMGLVFALLFVVWFACFCYQRVVIEKQELRLFENFSTTDRFACGYGAVVLLSYFFSAYREPGDYGDAWKGTTGWYMGACMQLLFLGVYFAVSRFWKKEKWLPALWLPVTLVIFLLGILNRFEFRPITMRNATPEFISTVGNINWYCGYMVILVFAFLYYIWRGEEKNPLRRSFLNVWQVIAFAAMITQGSLSGVLTLFVLLAVFYLLSMGSMDQMEAFLSCMVCLGIAATSIYLCRKIFPDAYNYKDAVLDFLSNSPVSIGVLVVAVAGWWCVRRWNVLRKDATKVFRSIGYGGCLLAGVAFAVYIILASWNTLHPQSIGALSNNTLFTFDYAWGSNRGATWSAAWMCFGDQNLWNKLIGIGPDTMVMYINSGKNGELLELVRSVFGNYNLTNAHNEWFTILVNEGILGMVAYAGIMVSAAIRYLKAGKYSAMAGACGMAVLAYTINNMVSFQQTMATSTLFLVLGIGEACMRTDKER